MKQENTILYLDNLQKLFSSDVIKAFKDTLDNEKQEAQHEESIDAG